MESPDTRVSRLSRSELSSQRYANFIQPLFGGDRVTDRIRYLEWLLTNNPFLEEQEALPIFVFREDDAMLGQLAIIPTQFNWQDQALKAGWCIDFFVSPQAQRRGLGKHLLQAAFRDYPLLMTLGQTDSAYRFFLKHGWKHEGCLTHYRTLLNPKRTLPKFLARKLRLAKADSNRQPDFSSAFLPHRLPEIGQITRTSDLSGYREPAASRKFIGSRTSEYLNWRYLNIPFGNYHMFRIEVERDTAVVVAIRKHVTDDWFQADVVDVIYAAEVSDSQLLKAVRSLKKYAAKLGAEKLECRTTDTRLLQALRNSPFSTQAPAQRFLFGVAEDFQWQAPLSEQILLSAADCDVDALAAFYSSRGTARDAF